MSESSATENTEKEIKQDAPRKRLRHRKKILYEKILKQMEFYFSDANLTKDRLLSQMIKEDPYVPLELFLKFNKIRAMTTDVNHIAKSLKNSTLLELSDDRTKVQRKTPLLPYDADVRTVYVESIPVTVNREWLEKVFQDYGPVAYISLPKFKDSQRIKGYGFVEFQSVEAAQNCLSAFTKMGCKLPTCMAPEELSSIKTFSMDAPAASPPPPPLPAPPPSTLYKPAEPPRKKSKKMKNMALKSNQESEDKKFDTPVEDDEMSTATEESEDIKTTDLESKFVSQDKAKLADDAAPRKKKKRKRTAKDKNKTKSSNEKEASKDALFGLQVLAKSEWKCLRNKYLNLQRANMRELKREVRARHYAPLAPLATLATLAPPLPHPLAQPRHMARPDRETEAAGAGAAAGGCEELPRGVFVAATLSQPCLNVRDTKRQLKSAEHLVHVEVREGQSDVILRFDSPAAAEEWARERRCGAGEAVEVAGAAVLRGGEEEAQREAWRRHRAVGEGDGPGGLHRLRGRQRLQARASSGCAGPAPPQPSATHIRFDDEQH